MRCLGCNTAAVTERLERTAQGYRRFRCRECGRQFNERSTGLLNRTQYPSDVIALVVLWRLRLQTEPTRPCRNVPDPRHRVQPRGGARLGGETHPGSGRRTPSPPTSARGRSWYVDETYIKVHGHWRYLYRAIDRDGALVDVMLSEHRDLAAAKAFFRSARMVTGVIPDRITTDGHDGYPAAIRSELGEAVRHRTNVYLNNRLEQDHRGIKDRYRPMRGFKSISSAGRFCRAFDELRSFLRSRSRMRQHVPAATRRWHHMRRTAIALGLLETA
jgi:putative transposase